MRGGRRAWRGLLRLLATAQLQHEEGRPYGRALRHAVCRANEQARRTTGGSGCEGVTGQAGRSCA